MSISWMTTRRFDVAPPVWIAIASRVAIAAVLATIFEPAVSHPNCALPDTPQTNLRMKIARFAMVYEGCGPKVLFLRKDWKQEHCPHSFGPENTSITHRKPTPGSSTNDNC